MKKIKLLEFGIIAITALVCTNTLQNSYTKVSALEELEPSSQIDSAEFLDSTLNIAKNSEFIKEIIGEEVLDRYIELKEIELRENLNANDKEMVKRKYFEYI